MQEIPVHGAECCAYQNHCPQRARTRLLVQSSPSPPVPAHRQARGGVSAHSLEEITENTTRNMSLLTAEFEIFSFKRVEAWMKWLEAIWTTRPHA